MYYALQSRQKIDIFFPQEHIQMGNIHVKKWSTSLINRERKIKTIPRYHLIPVRMAIIKK